MPNSIKFMSKGNSIYYQKQHKKRLMLNSNYYFTLMPNSNLSKVYVKVGSPRGLPAAYLVKKKTLKQHWINFPFLVLCAFYHANHWPCYCEFAKTGQKWTPTTYNVWPKWWMKGILSSDDICYAGNMKLNK